MEKTTKQLRDSWDVVFKTISNDLMALMLVKDFNDDAGKLAEALIEIESYLSNYIMDLENERRH